MGSEYVERLGEDVVVDEASVDGETSHHEDYVATAKKYLENFRIFDFLFQDSFLVDHV